MAAQLAPFVFGGALVLTLARAADAGRFPEDSWAPLATNPMCQQARATFPDITGRELTIGLGGYAQGFEMPLGADPSQIVGLDPDLFGMIDTCLGTRHQIIVTSFSILIASIGSGRVSIGPLLYETPKRTKRVDFVSVMSVTDAALGRVDGVPLSSEIVLCGRRVGAAAGTYEAVTLVPQQSARCTARRQAAIGLLLLQSTDAALQALRAARVDAVFMARPQAVAVAASDPRLRLGFTLHLPIVAGYPVAKTRPRLAAALLAALRAIQAIGLERDALTRWQMDPTAEWPAALLD